METEARLMTHDELTEYVEHMHYQEVSMDYYGVGNEAVRKDILDGLIAQYAGSRLLGDTVVLNQAA